MHEGNSMNQNEKVKLCKISVASDILGVGQGILRKWSDQGLIKTIRTPGGMRLFDISSIDPSVNISKVKIKEKPKVILYSRVSSSKQKDDLQRQQEYVRKNVPDQHRGSEYGIEEIFDIGSGINFKRPGLLRILGSVKEGNVSAIIVASRDRLARFGCELIEWMCSEFGTKIVVLDTEDTTPESELGKDLMAIVQVYCCRWNGMRRYKSKTKENCEGIQVETQPEQGTKGVPELLGRMLEISLQQDSVDVDKPKEQDSKGQNETSKQIGNVPKKRGRKPKQLLQQQALVVEMP